MTLWVCHPEFISGSLRSRIILAKAGTGMTKNLGSRLALRALGDDANEEAGRRGLPWGDRAWTYGFNRQMHVVKEARQAEVFA